MSDIIGFEACAEELRRLLQEIETNIQAAGEAGEEQLHQAIMTEPKKLVEFTNRTEPANLLDSDEVESIRQIDQQADKAVQDIFGNSAHQIINRMQSRIIQLNQLEKSVRQQAASNEEEARKIRLVPIRNAVEATTEVVVAIRDAKDMLANDNPAEALVKNKIDSVLRAITALKKATQELT
jgi:hypothetical protein